MNYTEEEQEVLNAIKVVRYYLKTEKLRINTEKLESDLFDLQEEIIGKAEFRYD